jgi:hypothetical protein
VQSGVSPSYIVDGDTLFGGVPYDAGRGILGGTDLDGDGLQEVWITSYEGKQVVCFEETGTDTFAYVWESAVTTADYSTPRDVHTGDLDGDGNGEIIFHVGRWTGASNPDAGLHVYEWDGTDNGYGTEAAFRVNFYDALNDSLAESRVEGFSIGDIDSDGQDEILLANNGGSNPFYQTQDGSTPYSEDRFIILSVSGGIGDFGTTIVEEYSMSPRDVNKDGIRNNSLGGGSPQDIVMCDTDGDGLLEAACFSWNNLAVFFIEATDTNAYTIGDTTWLKLTPSDDWTLGASVADMDMDGKDEVYVSGYGDGSLFVITDADGDATSLDQTGTAADDWAGNTEVAVIGSNSLGMAAVEEGAVFSGGWAANDVKMWELTAGGSALDINAWMASSYALTDSTATGSVLKMDAGWGDDDETLVVLLAYKGVADSVDVGGVMTLDPAGNRVFRIAEWDDGTMSVRDITTIMPDDYKLAQNFPNPFNPTTRIEYYLPMNNTISLTIYNMLGQEIVKLVNNKYTVGGSHFIVWNGTDKNGMKVGSGTYVYELRYGNFSKTRQMTFIK